MEDMALWGKNMNQQWDFWTSMWMRMNVYPGSMPVKIPDFSPTYCNVQINFSRQYTEGVWNVQVIGEV